MSHAARFKWLVVALVAGCTTAARAADALKRPNVVMIVSDDQGWTDFGFMGHGTVQTPRLDRLAEESALFTRGYVPSSLCRPSLMSMMTGLYPHQHKVSGNDPPPGVKDRNVLLKHIRGLRTIPKILGDEGYLTFQTGKWWEGNYREGGFTHGMSHGDPMQRGRHGDEGLKIGREGMQPIFDFINRAGDKPFFVWYAPMMPHSPHTPPDRLLEKYTRPDRSPHVARYYAMCEWFDETCGELLSFLNRKNLADDTLVLFVVDNGWIQSIDSPRFAPRSKTSPYDGGLRTPIMVRWPNHVKPQRSDALVSSIDLLPTILGACGISPDGKLPGVNLIDVAAGKSPAHDVVYGEVFAHDMADVDDPSASLEYRWCNDGRQKLIWPRDPNMPVQLYDIQDDPFETFNRTSEKPADVARLQKLLDAWWPVGVAGGE